MTSMTDMTGDALNTFHAQATERLAQLTSNRMQLDLTRGKPSTEQTALSDALDGALNGDYRAEDGTDTRNYGGLRGLPEARRLGAELLRCDASQVIAGGNSSLSLMHLVLDTALEKGLHAGMAPWRASEGAAVLTPVPGYDRHFALTETLGVGMVNIGMDDNGPDMDAARRLVENDERIKGIWCVPKYSNPTGCVYSDEVVQAIAELPKLAAADNFVVLWDNAYAVHDFDFPGTELASLSAAAQAAGTLDHTVQFASTSKVTFAGAGISFVASDEAVLAQLERQLSFTTIGPDKVNQLRHTRFLGGRVAEHMAAHAALLRPKFELVEQMLSEHLGGLDIAEWTHPKGGYFVSLDVRPGLAKRIVAMAGEVGLKLTAAGATFPYGQDPNDSNIRIAPTFADLDALEAAMEVLVLCVMLATAEQRLAKQK